MTRSMPSARPPQSVPVVAPDARPIREPKPRGMLCPFCGEVSPDLKQCRGCRAFLDPLSRQASQNEMGPWFLRDPAHPFRPGCSFDTIRRMIQRGKIGPMTVIRGPATRQTWSFAGRTPSIANLMGLCHNCQREVSPDAFSCAACGASFAPQTDRQHLGLSPVHLLPGQAPPEAIASAVAPAPQPVHAEPGVTLRGGGAHAAPRRATGLAAAGDARADQEQPPISPSAAAHIPSDVEALRARIRRLRAAAIVLVLLVLAAAGVLVAAFSGILVQVGQGGPLVPAAPAGRLVEEAPRTPAQAAPEPALPPEQDAGDDATGDVPPADEPLSDPAVTDAPEPPAPSPEPSPPGLSALERLLPIASRDPVDLAAVRAGLDALAGTIPQADASEWITAAERRARIQRLRALP